MMVGVTRSTTRSVDKHTGIRNGIEVMFMYGAQTAGIRHGAKARIGTALGVDGTDANSQCTTE